eukprot:1888093-Prymnesium_polylepis.1
MHVNDPTRHIIPHAPDTSWYTYCAQYNFCSGIKLRLACLLLGSAQLSQYSWVSPDLSPALILALSLHPSFPHNKATSGVSSTGGDGGVHVPLKTTRVAGAVAGWRAPRSCFHESRKPLSHVPSVFRNVFTLHTLSSVRRSSPPRPGPSSAVWRPSTEPDHYTTPGLWNGRKPKSPKANHIHKTKHATRGRARATRRKPRWTAK